MQTRTLQQLNYFRWVILGVWARRQLLQMLGAKAESIVNRLEWEKDDRLDRIPALELGEVWHLMQIYPSTILINFLICNFRANRNIGPTGSQRSPSKNIKLNCSTNVYLWNARSVLYHWWNFQPLRFWRSIDWCAKLDPTLALLFC